MKILRRLLLLALLTGAGSLLLAELARPLETTGDANMAQTQVAPAPIPEGAVAEVTPSAEKPVNSAEPLSAGTHGSDYKAALDGKDYKEVLDAKDYKEALPEIGEGPLGGPGSLGSSGGAFANPSLPPQILPPELPPGTDVTTP
ncbi:MAG: hypothetical protein H7Y20_11710 [Bryobacteraceae bacterium]|nr:hypothetical protein [Bryobacteraceae bacterium]